MNDEEKDVYIKGKIKDNYIPEEIDNLFNNSIKVIENKGEKTMEENLNMNQEQNQNNQNKTEKKKMPGALKRVLATAACLTVFLGGGNLYATSQGYDNIFFLIKHIVTGEDVRGKDNILLDREIVISYKQLDITKDLSIEIPTLVVKENQAKLNIEIVSYKELEDNEKLNLKYEITNEDGKKLCSQEGKVITKDQMVVNEELLMKNFTDNTKILNFTIYNKENNVKISEIAIDLEKREVTIKSNEEMQKISEVELKKYLSAFANMAIKYPVEEQDTNYTDIQFKNEKIIEASIIIARMNNITYGTHTFDEVYTGIKAEDINKIAKSFTNIELDKNGAMEVGILFETRLNSKKEAYYKFNELDGAAYHNPQCLSVDDISWVAGKYQITFTFCDLSSIGRETDGEEIEDLDRYQTKITLKLNEDTSISKYSIVSIEEAVLLEEEKVDKEEVSNETISNEQAQKIIQSFRNIMASNDAHTTGMLSIEEISLVTEEEFMQIHNDNRLNRDDEGYMKTDLKYSNLENKLLEYMTKELIERDIHGYKDVNGYLWVADMGASGYSYKIDNVKVVESFENKIVYEVSETKQWIDSNETYTRKYELMKNENGKYVVSNWGWDMEVKESLQNYLDLAGVYEGSPSNLLVKLNLLKAEDINYFDADTDSEGFVKTNIKYSDYKEAMLNYVSESWFNERFTALYKEKSGYLYYHNGGGTGRETKVEKIGKYSDGAYTATVYNIGVDGDKSDTYNIKFKVEYNEKYVISYYK